MSFVCGAVTHALLFIGHGLFKSGIIGSAGLLVYAAVIGFAPIILGGDCEPVLQALSRCGPFRRNRSARIAVVTERLRMM